MTKFRNLKEELDPRNGVVFDRSGSIYLFENRLQDLRIYLDGDEPPLVKVIVDEDGKVYLSKTTDEYRGYYADMYDSIIGECYIDTNGELEDELAFKVGKVYKLEETEAYSKIFEIVGVKVK